LFDADFADLFEVRGVRRSRRGYFYQPEVARDRVRFKYQGLDGKNRFTWVVFDPEPAELQHGRASFRLTLRPDQPQAMEIQVTCGYEECGSRAEKPVKFARTLAKRRSEIASLHPGWSSITASSEPLNNLLSRSTADLTSIMQDTAEGTFIMAGIPWFAT